MYGIVLGRFSTYYVEKSKTVWVRATGETLGGALCKTLVEIFGDTLDEILSETFGNTLGRIFSETPCETLVKTVGEI